MGPAGSDVGSFEAERGRLFGVAYRMLGSASDAEDVVQQAYLRWHRADRDEIRDLPAWLTTVVVNLALTHLESARVRRERYVGAWLPEPLLTPDPSLGPADTAEQRESLTFAMLILLDRLPPRERAVFVLREALGYSHREIAAALQVSEGHARQLLRRARGTLQDVEPGHPRAPRATERQTAERFLDALRRADAEELQRLMTAEVTSTADGGGQVTAARRPVRGRERVLRYLLGFQTHPQAVGITRMEIAEVNGRPGMLVHTDRLIAVVVPRPRGDRIAELFILLNPDKLGFVSRQATPGR